MLFARDRVVWVDDICWNGIVLIVNCFFAGNGKQVVTWWQEYC